MEESIKLFLPRNALLEHEGNSRAHVLLGDLNAMLIVALTSVA